MIPMYVNVAAAAVTTVLAFSSGRNMLQTSSISRHSSTYSPEFVRNGLSIHPDDSTEAVVSKLQSMKRKELLQLYFASKGPADLSQILGEWDGRLLDNNSWVMTSVTALLTDRLFGRFRKWNGKEFGTDNNQQQGMNRFYPRQNKQQQASDVIESVKSGMIEKEHKFDLRILPTKLGGSKQTKKDPSLVLHYSKHQSPLSLWRTMMDEIRIVPLDSNNDDENEREARVLIGLGYMAWSGGRLNASPFVLYRPTTTNTASSGGATSIEGTNTLPPDL